MVGRAAYHSPSDILADARIWITGVGWRHGWARGLSFAQWRRLLSEEAHLGDPSVVKRALERVILGSDINANRPLCSAEYQPVDARIYGVTMDVYDLKKLLLKTAIGLIGPA